MHYQCVIVLSPFDLVDKESVRDRNTLDPLYQRGERTRSQHPRPAKKRSSTIRPLPT